MNAGGSTTRGLSPLTDSDVNEDAPQAPHVERDSAMIRRVLAPMVTQALEALPRSRFVRQHPALARALRWGALSLGLLGGGGAAAYATLGDSPERCDPIVLQHILHLAEAGETLAQTMESAGRHAEAAQLLEMTDPKNLPEDIQLCVLLSSRSSHP